MLNLFTPKSREYVQKSAWNAGVSYDRKTTCLFPYTCGERTATWRQIGALAERRCSRSHRLSQFRTGKVLDWVHACLLALTQVPWER